MRESQGRDQRARDQDQRIGDAVLEQRPGRRRLEHRQGEVDAGARLRSSPRTPVTLPAKRRRLQLGVERRQHAGGIGAAGRRCCSPAAARRPAAARGSAVPMRCLRPKSRNTPSRWKIWLIRSSARASSALPLARHRHAPRHLGEAELLLDSAAAKAGIGEVLGEEAVVLRGQRAGLVLQPVGQHARLVEQHEARALRDQLGVRAVADGDADGAARQVLPVPAPAASRGPTTVVSDR